MCGLFRSQWEGALLKDSPPRIAGSYPQRRCRTLIALSALFFTTLPVWLPSYAAAQAVLDKVPLVPATLSNTPRDMRFVYLRARQEHAGPLQQISEQ
jgi:hypothetical protein